MNCLKPNLPHSSFMKNYFQQKDLLRTTPLHPNRYAKSHGLTQRETTNLKWENADP